MFAKMSGWRVLTICRVCNCALACKGKRCKYDSDNWGRTEMVIPGLYSHWITNRILAMARPRSKFHIQGLAAEDVCSVYNLQVCDEHSHCGQGLAKHSNFSYDLFDMDEMNIKVQLVPIPDFGSVAIDRVLQICQHIQADLDERESAKVAVHCHAGRGRTGMIIACYLIFSGGLSGEQAIDHVRSIRPGSIESKLQLKTVFKFEQSYRWTYDMLWPSCQSQWSNYMEIVLAQRIRLPKHPCEIPAVLQLCVNRLLVLSKQTELMISAECILEVLFQVCCHPASCENLNELNARRHNELCTDSKLMNFLSHSDSIGLICECLCWWLFAPSDDSLLSLDDVSDIEIRIDNQDGRVEDYRSLRLGRSDYFSAMEMEILNFKQAVIDLVSHLLRELYRAAVDKERYFEMARMVMFILVSSRQHYSELSTSNSFRWLGILGDPISSQTHMVLESAIKSWLLS